MREAFLLLFLIAVYNYILYYITRENLTLIPLFPKDPVNMIVVLSFNAVLYISWLFGERRKLVALLGYLFFFQISLLALIYGDPYVFVSNLFPVILTFMFVVLFESPFEKKQKALTEEREKLLKELEQLERERSQVEERIREFRRSVNLLRLQLEEKEKELREAKKLKESAEEVEKKEREVERFREKLKEMERELEKQRSKELKLLEANRKLFQMLELLGKEEERKRGSKEVKTLRKERKKLIKEVLELQELLEVYEKENEELRKSAQELRGKVEELERKLTEEELKREELERSAKRREEVYGELLSLWLPQLSFTKEALRDFARLDREKKKRALAELEKLPAVKPEPITTAKGLYKLKFSGGRIYLRQRGEKWEVAGILDSEEDADKARVIERLRGG